MGSSRLIVSPSVSPAQSVSGDQDQESALATLYSLEADSPESVSAVGSTESSNVSTPRSVAAPGGGGGEAAR